MEYTRLFVILATVMHDRKMGDIYIAGLGLGSQSGYRYPSKKWVQ